MTNVILLRENVICLIVFSKQLEMRLRVCARRALCGSLCSFRDMPTVTALPFDGGVLLEYLAFLHVLEQFSVSPLVLFFYFGHSFKGLCYLIESFFLCRFPFT